jgi:hypothetical protein
MIVERKITLKQNKIGPLKIKNYKFKRGENFKNLGVMLNEDNSHPVLFKERMKNANKSYFLLQNFFNDNPPSQKKNHTKERNNRQNIHV